MSAAGRWIRTSRKTAAAGRFLPLPDVLLAELVAAKARQAAERLALGEAYSELGYVVCNEAGEPYHPSTMSTMWQSAIKNLDVPQIRLRRRRTPAPLSCTCKVFPSHWSPPGSATPTFRSRCGPTSMLRPTPSSSRPEALLPGHRPPRADPVAHACGDTLPTLVTICDNFGSPEHTWRSTCFRGRLCAGQGCFRLRGRMFGVSRVK